MFFETADSKIKFGMKKINSVALFLMLIILLTASLGSVTAQNPPPPPGQHELSGDQPPQGGNAPIGGALILTIGLGLAYGVRKIYNFRNNENQ